MLNVLCRRFRSGGNFMRTGAYRAVRKLRFWTPACNSRPSGAMQLAASRPATSRVGLPRQRLSCGKESVLTHPEFLISWPTDRISLTGRSREQFQSNAKGARQTSYARGGLSTVWGAASCPIGNRTLKTGRFPSRSSARLSCGARMDAALGAQRRSCQTISALHRRMCIPAHQQASRWSACRL